jgi:hypothetical protein
MERRRIHSLIAFTKRTNRKGRTGGGAKIVSVELSALIPPFNQRQIWRPVGASLDFVKKLNGETGLST